MDKVNFSTYKVEDRSYLSFIKREIHNLLSQAGFSINRTGEIDIIVSELTSNLIKFANSGELLYRLSREGEQPAFEIFCMDNGPGIADISKMMKDGTSSTHTLGHGLGSMSRLSDVFRIYSMSGWGTIVYSKSYKEKELVHHRLPVPDVSLMGLQICYPGEIVCGDGYGIRKTTDSTLIFMGDGLGHGPHANEAIQAALEGFYMCPEVNDPVEVLRFIDRRVKKTRGLVGTVAILDKAAKSWKICGVGNISTRLCQGINAKNYMSNNGILGLNVPNTMHNYEVEADSSQCLIMNSDGLKSRWDLSKYPSLLKHDPSIIASAIFKDNLRGNDDASILVVKINI